MADKPKGDSGGAMRIDTDLVRELAQLLEANQLTEIEVEDGNRKIKVVRGGAPMAFAPFASTAAAAPAAPAADAPEPTVADGTLVKSPMVGTAFLSAEPGAKPFAGVGDTVKAGDTLMIIEAMKVMNPITAPTAGKIKQVMISDSQPVEFDQPLLVIG